MRVLGFHGADKIDKTTLRDIIFRLCNLLMKFMVLPKEKSKRILSIYTLKRYNNNYVQALDIAVKK